MTAVSQGVIEHFGLQSALLACCTPAFYDVQSQLARRNPEAFHCRKPQPEAVWTQSVFPVSGIWNHLGGHADGVHRPFAVFPGSFRVSSLTYLDTGVAQGGGTAVWPGSHRRLRETAAQDPDRYRMLPDLKNPQQKFDLGEPVELTPSRETYCFFIIFWCTPDLSTQAINRVSPSGGCAPATPAASGKNTASGISGCREVDECRGMAVQQHDNRSNSLQ